MSNQGAFEPTKICSAGRTPGSSSSVPSADEKLPGRRVLMNWSVEPQPRQKVRVTSADERFIAGSSGVLAPLVHQNIEVLHMRRKLEQVLCVLLQVMRLLDVPARVGAYLVARTQ